jgi:ubiquinone/menaquinone biosynthesis C-methylase UbiE
LERLYFGLLRLRSTLFTAESFFLPLADFLATGRKPRLPFDDIKIFLSIRKSLLELLKKDANRIRRGVYPAKVLAMGEFGHSPLEHFFRIPKLFLDSVRAAERRKNKQTKVFSHSAEKKKKKMPDYYQRNFHFQKDGYLSAESADLYEHQVELLFVGGADAMRRMCIEPLKDNLNNISRPRILEIGCGVGSTTQFIREVFPKAEIVAVDLSEPYLELAKKRFKGVNFQQALGENLPFEDRTFDAVYSVFLFHELPKPIRLQVLQEGYRVLKPKGAFVMVDALQEQDAPSFAEPLRRFPKEYHEPFFANYTKNPMETLFEEVGFQDQKSELGFFSKMLMGIKK